MPYDAFSELFWRHQRSGIIRPANRYIGDLWDLFSPDYRGRLPEYYHQQELQLTMTFLAYASQPEELERHYLEPYRLMRQRFPRAAILEVGPGIPHGFLANLRTDGGAWCESLTIVEVDSLYARFTEWICRRHNVPFDHLRANAAKAPTISSPGPFQFVYAKDVFEHLDDPAITINEILRVAAPQSTLALDLYDRGKIEYQHITMALSHHAQTIVAAGFRWAGESGNMTIFTR
jgi:hypothetical protein